MKVGINRELYATGQNCGCIYYLTVGYSGMYYSGIVITGISDFGGGSPAMDRP
jgi:hypothetical protein